MNIRTVIQDFQKLKCMTQKYFQLGQFERALQTVYYACGFMYTMNQVLYDDELERIVCNIAAQVVEDPDINKCYPENIMFYDGFGNLNRGLSRIYIEALKELGYTIKYITFSKFKGNKEEFTETVGQGNVLFIEGENFVSQLQSLSSIVVNCSASKVFICMNPDDVVAVGVFSLFNKKIRRYLLNITDHAFWLGRTVCDKIINFREFGTKICVDKRHIPMSKNVYIPYFPYINRNIIDEGIEDYITDKYIFSGGSIYKTESKDKRYYALVKSILDSFDVKFVFMGNGSGRSFRKLKKQYPERVYVHKENQNFFCVLRNSVCYLSTYPYNGGLMTQYSLAAKKVPVTLCCTGVEQELSINHNNVFWNFTTMEECICEIHKLLNDESYRKYQGNRLCEFLVSPKQFKEELEVFLRDEKSIRKVSTWEYEFEGFRKMPLEVYCGFRYARLFFRKRGLYLFANFPVKYVAGAIYMIWEKIYKVR